MMKKLYLLSGIFCCFILMMSLSGCNSTQKAQTLATDTLAKITHIELIRQGGFPVQIKVKIDGVLPDTCTAFKNIEQRRKDNIFSINLIVQPHPGIKCTGSEAPFGVEVPLELAGLPKGKYKVKVNNKEAGFELKQDNEFE